MSFVHVDDDCEFSIFNLPYGCFSTAERPYKRCGVAIGSFVLDLTLLVDAGLLSSLPFDASSVFLADSLKPFMSLRRSDWVATRRRIQQLLSSSDCDSSPESAELRDNHTLRSVALVPMSQVTMYLPTEIGDYTDFYSSREHATNVGIMFRGRENALQPNWLHLPVGYHGRSSSIVVSGTDVVRPCGQLQTDRSDASKGSVYGPTASMDFELEMAAFVGGSTNPIGCPLSIDEARERIFGLVLMNDWSARDIQAWEYVPLGPFTSKNFCTSISPWVVTLEALEPFAAETSAGQAGQCEPSPLPYLTDSAYSTSSFDIQLQVRILPKEFSSSSSFPSLQPSITAGAVNIGDGQTEIERARETEKGSLVSTTNLRCLYWNFAQQLCHHSVTGCPMRAGDLIGSGTISGSDESSLGSMLELSWKGERDVLLTKEGNISDSGTRIAVRKFLNDGDEVVMTGQCRRKDGQCSQGYTVGFGPLRGKVLPAGSGQSSRQITEDIASRELAASPPRLYHPNHSHRFHSFRIVSESDKPSGWINSRRIAIALEVKGIPYSLVKQRASTIKSSCQLEMECSLSGKIVCVDRAMSAVELIEELYPSSSNPLLPFGIEERVNARKLSECVNEIVGILDRTNLASADDSDQHDVRADLPFPAPVCDLTCALSHLEDSMAFALRNVRGCSSSDERIYRLTAADFSVALLAMSMRKLSAEPQHLQLSSINRIVQLCQADNVFQRTLARFLAETTP